MKGRKRKTKKDEQEEQARKEEGNILTTCL